MTACAGAPVAVAPPDRCFHLTSGEWTPTRSTASSFADPPNGLRLTYDTFPPPVEPPGVIDLDGRARAGHPRAVMEFPNGRTITTYWTVGPSGSVLVTDGSIFGGLGLQLRDTGPGLEGTVSDASGHTLASYRSATIVAEPAPCPA